MLHRQGDVRSTILTSKSTSVPNLTAQTSVLITNSKQLFSWGDYDLSLYIPENSLPVNLQQCNIHIKASITGDYQLLPQDTHFVSAVFWFECVPRCQFSKPLVLEIQHCAEPGNSSELQFVRAEVEQENAVFRPVSSITQAGFPTQNSYGFIELNSFSGYGVSKKGAKKRQYRALVYYCKENSKSHQIHFVISWNTKAHKKVCYLILNLHKLSY